MHFTGEIRCGKTIWSDPEAVIEHVAKLEGKRVSVSIEQWRPRRSDEQNRYYRGVILKTLEDANIGYLAEEWHEILRHMYLLVEKNGRSFPRSTSSLSTVDMADYMDKCIRFAATEFSVVIPDPR